MPILARALALALACFSLTAVPAAAAPGDLVTSFGSGGVYYEFFTGQEYGENFDAFGYAHRPEDGAPLVLGNAHDNGTDACYAVQLTADGQRDVSFAAGGELMLRGVDGGSYCHRFTDAAFTGDRVYLIVDTAVQRQIVAFNRAGERVVSWAGDGTYSCLGPCQDLVALPDGRLLASSEDGRVERVTGDGQRDPDFQAAASGEPAFEAGALRLSGDRVLVAGNIERLYPEAPSGLVLARDLGTGAPIAVFGGSDRVSLPFELGRGQWEVDNYPFAAAPDGSFSVTSLSQDSTVDRVHRFTPSGIPDPAFGEGGIWSSASSLDTYPAMPISALALDHAGRTLLISQRTPSDANGRQVLARLTAEGRLDAGFGDSGYVTVPSPAFGSDVPNQWAVGISTLGESVLVGGVTTKPGTVNPYGGQEGNQLVPAVWAFDNSGEEESYCLLPPEDGGEMDDADEVPEGGTVYPEPAARTSSRRSAASGRAAAASTPTKARIRFGPVDAVGCFSQTSPGHWTNNSPTVRMNGIDVLTGSEHLDFDTNAWKVSSHGKPVELRVGGMPVYAGSLSHDFHNARLFWQNGLTGTSFTVKGLKLNGKAQAEFLAPGGGTGSSKLTLTATIPGTAGFKGFSVADGSVEIALSANNEKGLQWPAVKGQLGQLGVGPFGIKDGSLAYDFAEGAWSMEALVGLPFPAVPFVGGGATVKGGHLTGFTAKAETKIPLGASPFFLTAMNFGFASGDDGATLTGTGGATVSFGPPLPVPGGENGALSGAVQGTYSSGRPGSFTMTGDLKMVNVPLSDGRVAFTTDLRKIDFEGRARLHGRVGALDLYQAEGKLFGWFDPAANWQAQGNVQNVRFLRWEFPNAQALASSAGMGVCVATPKDGPRIGFGYDYRNFRAIADQCDVGRFAAVRAKAGASGRATALPTRRTVKVVKGQDLAVFALASDEPPDVSVRGPGLRLRPPAEGSAQGKRYMVGRSEVEATTYVVLLRPRPGRYTLRSRQPLRSVQVAKELPEVDVRARVTGSGAQRTLRWRSTPVAGQVVRLVSTAPDGAVREIVASGKASGEQAFTVDGDGEHVVRALVERHGYLRSSVEVARYRLADAGPLAAPSKLTAKRSGRKLRVRWSAVDGAARYRVALAGGGRTRRLTVTRPRLTMKFPGSRKVRLKVVAEATDGRRSSAARLTLKRRR